MCLAGVKAVSIHDVKDTTTIDLGGQFYLSEASVGQNRAEATLPLLQALNPAVAVTSITSPIDNMDLLQDHNIVILCDALLEDSIGISEFCRNNDIKFIMADVRGPFSWVFTDFGEGFTTYDRDGEPVKEVSKCCLCGQS